MLLLDGTAKERVSAVKDLFMCGQSVCMRELFYEMQRKRLALYSQV